MDEEKYTCIKCGGLVFWNEEQKSFYCSMAAKTKGRQCSVCGWGAGDRNGELNTDSIHLIKIAKDQELKNK